MTALLSARALAKSYGELDVLGEISLEVGPGEVCCLVGPTGCGKSTLLRLLLALESPDAGTLTVGASGAEVGVVFQDDALLPWRTVADNVALPLELAGVGAGERRERALASLRHVGLDRRADQLPGELSGGMRQYVSLARAMVGEPRLLVLDEPFGHFDPESRVAVETLLLEWLGERGTAALFVTHNIEEAVFLGDRVAVLSAKPSAIKQTVEVGLERPRSLDDPRLVELRREITELIKWW
jgi:ABC-type nitrate/sulfonate/bicarbonate transport system ATPase subunit